MCSACVSGQEGSKEEVAVAQCLRDWDVSRTVLGVEKVPVNGGQRQRVSAGVKPLGQSAHRDSSQGLRDELGASDKWKDVMWCRP